MSSIGRPPFAVDSRLYRLIDAGTLGPTIATVSALARALGVTRQRLGYWTNGVQWAPIEVVRRIERMTRGEMRLGHWPRVRDRDTGQFWENGRATAGPYGT